MKYLGGKSRTCQHIASSIEQFLKDGMEYVEPFVGGAWVLSKVKWPKRYASDNHKDLILMFQALQSGWMPPDNISEKEYKEFKKQSPSALRGFVGHCQSWGGKWWGGYARGEGRNYAKEGKNSLLKKIRTCPSEEVIFENRDYRDVLAEKENCVIYMDPPYKDTTDYQNEYNSLFNHEEFWELVRQSAQKNVVLVSECQAPQDFIKLKMLKVVSGYGIENTNAKDIRAEYLFTC